jgi:hypothetical protein
MKNLPTQEPRKEGGKNKKKYQEPTFRFERVFEVSALTCGKVSSSQGPCHTNVKLS